MDWRKFLIDEIDIGLSKRDLTYSQIKELEKAASMLQGADGADALLEKAVSMCREIETKYDKYASDPAGLNKSDVRDAIDFFKLQSEYRESSSMLKKCEDRLNAILKQEEEEVRKQKKKTIMIGGAIAVAAIVAIIVMVMMNQARNAKLMKQIQENIANEAYEDAYAGIVDYSYSSISEKDDIDRFMISYLENTLKEEGYAGAHDLWQQMKEDNISSEMLTKEYNEIMKNDLLEKVAACSSMDDYQAVYEDTKYVEDEIIKDSPEISRFFIDYLNIVLHNSGYRKAEELYKEMYQRVYIEDKNTQFTEMVWNYLEDLNNDPETQDDAYDEMCQVLESDTVEKNEDIAQRILSQKTDRIVESMTSGEHVDEILGDENTWEIFDSVQFAPDTALKMVYALAEQGKDVEALFPNGIQINLPMARYIADSRSKMLSAGIEEDPSVYPDLSKVIPIGIVENSDAVMNVKFSESMPYVPNPVAFINNGLESNVDKVQLKDDTYSVVLLPKYLMQLEESNRAANMAECTALIARQSLYVMAGSINTVTKRGYLKISDSDTPYFGAADMVVVYAANDPNASLIVNAQYDDATVAEEGWFDAHKNDPNLKSKENMMGESDPEALDQKYAEFINEFDFYKLLLGIAG